MPHPRTTMRDVARLAGVDPAVVSRLLNGDSRLSVRPETRQRVLDAVSKLDYKPNTAARSLRTDRAYAYGLVIPDFHNSVYAAIIEGAQDAALARNCALLTASLSSPGAAIRKLADVLGTGVIDGLLVAGAADPEELIQLFRSHGRPVLTLNRRVHGFDRYVILDDVRAAEVAVDHLIQLGHTRLAHIAGPRRSDTAERRLAGFQNATERAGLTWPGGHVVHADYTPAGGYEAMTRLLTLPERPTAVVTANLVSALGALSAIRTAGLQVPGDISLVSIHDDQLADFASPPLTVVRMPLYEMGRQAVELLSTVGSDESVEVVVNDPITLVTRESTAAPRRDASTAAPAHTKGSDSSGNQGLSTGARRGS